MGEMEGIIATTETTRDEARGAGQDAITHAITHLLSTLRPHDSTTFRCQADPNVDAEESSSKPLIAATASDNMEMMQLLLEYGECTYFCDHHGNMTAVDLLCRYDSTANLQNRRHRAPIIEGRSHGHHDVVQYLLRVEHTETASKLDAFMPLLLPPLLLLSWQVMHDLSALSASCYCNKCMPMRDFPCLVNTLSSNTSSSLSSCFITLPPLCTSISPPLSSLRAIASLFIPSTPLLLCLLRSPPKRDEGD
ncbi:unnamed protein product [Hydatigera taeniaeformis]|uniref:ANK_REP_REGION domain-containing protein n=1 Tax=Hydatigena taeniaeformis TaxID=6205 RepID=A0A0R3X8U6_HYDTA|nr:unnamed protein product [Hydatigera taeniaeformis]